MRIALPARVLQHLGVLLYFMLVSVMLTWPLALHLDSFISGDKMQFSWLIQTVGERLYAGIPVLGFESGMFTTSGFELLQGIDNIATHIILGALSPILPPTVGLNLAFLFFLALGGYGGFLLGQHLWKDTSISLFFGTAFGLSNFALLRSTEHLNIVTIVVFPLLLLGILKVFKEPDKQSHYLFSAAVFGGSFYLSMGWMIYVYPLLILTALVFCVIHRKQLLGYLWNMLSFLVMSGVLLAPLAVSFLNLGELSAASRNPEEIIIWSADLLSFVLPSTWGLHSFLGNAWEQGVFLSPILLFGVVLMVLLRTTTKRPYRWVFLLLGCYGLLLSLGEALVFNGAPLMVGERQILMPFHWLREWLPLFDIIRTPNRFFPLLLLATSYFAAEGFRRLAEWRSWKSAAALLPVTALFLGLQVWFFQYGTPTAPFEVSVEATRSIPDGALVYHLSNAPNKWAQMETPWLAYHVPQARFVHGYVSETAIPVELRDELNDPSWYFSCERSFTASSLAAFVSTLKERNVSYLIATPDVHGQECIGFDQLRRSPSMVEVYVDEHLMIYTIP